MTTDTITTLTPTDSGSCGAGQFAGALVVVRSARVNRRLEPTVAA